MLNLGASLVRHGSPLRSSRKPAAYGQRFHPLFIFVNHKMATIEAGPRRDLPMRFWQKAPAVPTAGAFLFERGNRVSPP